MKAGQKEKNMTIVGLVIFIAGVAWFLLSLAGLFSGLSMMLGYFLGIGLAFCGLIFIAIYLFRLQRIRRLLQGKDVLARWVGRNGESIIAPFGALVDDELHLWGIAGTRLEAAAVDQGTQGSGAACLTITYGEATNSRSIAGSILWRQKKVSIPLPAGAEALAASVVDKLVSKIKK